MSDDATGREAPNVDDAQGAVDPAQTTPPWGDDFDAERAWSTITTLRGKEKELEARAKQLDRLSSDPEALNEFVLEHFEVDEDEGDEGEPELDDDDPYAELRQELADLKKDNVSLKERFQQEDLAKLDVEVTEHIQDLAKEADVKLTPRQVKWIKSESTAAGLSPSATEEAFKGLVEELELVRNEATTAHRKSKRAPANPQSGSGGADKIDMSKKSDRVKRLMDLSTALDAANE